MSQRAQLLLLLMLTIVVFAPEQGAVLVWDDSELIGRNDFASTWTNLPLFFLVDLWHGVPGEHAASFYRPLMLVEILLDQSLFEDNAAAMQLHSLAWHLGAVTLLYLFLRQRFELGAIAGAAFFALHPFQAETARFIVARNDTMAVAGVLACFLLARRPVASGVCLLLALLSKESAVLALPAWLLWERALPSKRTQAAWVGALVVYGLLRLSADLEPLLLVLKPELADATGHYLGCLVSPLWCNSALSPLAVEQQPLAIASTLGLCALLAWRGRWGIAFAALATIPAVLAAVMSEGLGHRYMMFSLLGLSWAFAATVQATQRSWVVWAFVPLLAAGSRQMLPRWTDTVTLWREANLIHSSLRSRCGAFKALEWSGGDDLEASMYLRNSFPNSTCCYNGSRFWLDRNEPAKAVEMGRHALRQGCAPEPNLLAPLARAEALEGDWEAAVEHAGDGRDPYGYGPVVLSAAALREGDESVLNYWQSQGSGDLRALVDELRSLSKLP